MNLFVCQHFALVCVTTKAKSCEILLCCFIEHVDVVKRWIKYYYNKFNKYFAAFAAEQKASKIGFIKSAVKHFINFSLFHKFLN